MTTNALKSVGSKSSASTPQNKKAVAGQKKNQAGGFSFVITPLDRAKRFLILGSENNFYGPAQKLTADNAKNLIKLAENDETSNQLVDAIVEVSTEGRAPKQDFGLFALAVATTHGSPEARSYAYAQLNAVARTASSLFTFIAYRLQFGAWSMGLRKAVSRWYLNRPAEALGYQAVKYRQREGWTHRDVLRSAHPRAGHAEQARVFDYLVKGNYVPELPKVITDYEAAKSVRGRELYENIRDSNLSWDMLPTDVLKDPKVWEALLDAGNIPLGALIRNLGRLTALGVIKPLGPYNKVVAGLLTDQDAISRARIHPLKVLEAQYIYAAGRGEKGSLTWTPESKITAALDKAFYLAFKSVVPTGKRYLLGLDVSGSMSSPFGQTHLSSREAVTAMALATVAAEDDVHVIGFTGGYALHGGASYGNGWYWNQSPAAYTVDEAVTVLNVNPADSLAVNVSRTESLPFGSTDCALPMVYAMEKGLEVDVFVIYTDNDTWVGRVHPFEALKQYRAKTGIDAKLIVMSTRATRFSIANPDDAGMLDIPGFDSAAPQIISEFSRGL